MLMYFHLRNYQSTRAIFFCIVEPAFWAPVVTLTVRNTYLPHDIPLLPGSAIREFFRVSFRLYVSFSLFVTDYLICPVTLQMYSR